MPGLEEMASKGKAKLSAKLPNMPASYRAAIPQAKENYGRCPFGGIVKANYNAAMDSYAAPNYDIGMDSTAVDKWYRNWMSKMSR